MRTVEHIAADAAQASPTPKTRVHQLACIKNESAAAFRSQTARDVGCILDVDRNVARWRCNPLAGDFEHRAAGPDFLVTFMDGSRCYIDAPDLKRLEPQTARLLEAEYRQIAFEELYDGFRLQNARDLLRYGGWRVSLGDRVRLLAALDEHGSLSFVECLSAIQETKPVAAVASLILSGYVDVDLDEAPLGPETMVRRIRR